jgi:selenocysteine-specific elongation factor
MATAPPAELLELALDETTSGEEPAADPSGWSDHPLLGPARRRWRPDECRAAVQQMIAGGQARERNGRLVAPEADAVQPERPAPELDQLALRALEALVADGASPRSPAALAEELGCERDRALAALEDAASAGKAVRVKPGVYYDSDCLEQLTEELLARAAESGGEITLPEAKALLGTSRKYAQALLEHLDARHLTVRQGDRHVVRRAARGKAATGT